MDCSRIYDQYMYSYPHKTAYRPLEGVFLPDYHDSLQEGGNSLYFHVPFCQRKCGYCNLFSLTGQTEKQRDIYLAACERQARQYRMKEIAFQDITIGGGTPLLLSVRQLEKLFSIADTWFSFTGKDRPAAIETAPNQTDEEKLDLLKRHGVTRVSLGVQSFQQAELEGLRRRHTVKQARRALNIIKQKQFPCMNVDLIYGIPGQTEETVKLSLEEAVSWQPEELFCYPLYIKPGTGLSAVHTERHRHTYRLYCLARDYLSGRGYQQVSMRRFVRADFKTAVKNTGCGSENTVAVGCGGRSYVGALHFCSPYGVGQAACREILKDYLNQTDYNQVKHGYLLSAEEQKRRYIIKNLFFITGIHLPEYKERFRETAEEGFPIIRQWLAEGYVREEGEFLTVTEKGMALSDCLGPALISDEVREKMRSWRE